MFLLHPATAALVAIAFSAITCIDAAAQPESGQRVIVTEDADYFGSDYRTVQDVALDGCKAACLRDSTCRAFTYNPTARLCFLKNDFGELRNAPGAIAGRIAVAGTATIEAAAKPPKLNFIPSDLGEAAVALAGSIASHSLPSQGVEALRRSAADAASSGETPAEVDSLSKALRLAPDDAGLWLGLARALLSLGDRGSDGAGKHFENASGAALNAYEHSASADERAAALAVLAVGLERQQRFRPALEAYRQSLTLVSSAAIADAYDRLRARHGFRVVDHTVDADSSAPRVCIQFSEELRVSDTDFARFVTVDDKAPAAVDARDRQLCLSGLEHGSRYRIGLRSGIPSTVHEVLERPVSLSVYVRDRKPSARFTGRNFVLPRFGSRGVPVVSVNVQTLKVALYRIGERGLADMVRKEQLFSQLDEYAAGTIADDSGTLLWKGELDVRPERNREVTTSFPIDAALPDRLPGLYVMVAEPKPSTARYWESRATQWFVVSDIGLTSLEGADGLHVFARSLSTARALSDVEVKLIARNNEILGTLRTDAEGHAHFEDGLTRGKGGAAPALVTAAIGATDQSFLQLTTPGFDLADRGVAGRAAPGPLDAFLYTDRGVYRPGETVHLGALVRDREAVGVTGIPVTFVFDRPDGVEHRRILAADGAAGGRTVALELQASAMRGTWRVRAYADPEADAIAEMRFLVEDFVPDRIEFDLTSTAQELSTQTPVPVEVAGRYLYGAPASALRLEGEITVTPATEVPGYPGFSFGLFTEEAQAERSPLEDLPVTDADGTAAFPVVADMVPATSRALEATLAVRLREGGGRAVERTLVRPVVGTNRLIGIRPLFGDGRLGEGETARFEVIAISGSGERIALHDVSWQLLKLDQDFQWYQTGGSWQYEPVTYTTRVADGRIDIAQGAATSIAGQVEWGRYRLEVTSADAAGPAASIEFDAGWYAARSSGDSPDNLQIGLDKQAYRPGETARVSITPRFAGTALVMVIGERLLEMKAVDIGLEETVVAMPVGEDWGAGAYVAVSLLRPTDLPRSHMPGRAMGLQWLAVDQSSRTLGVSLDVAEQAAPRAPLVVPVTVEGAAPGDRAFVTVAAVDVGILNLTGHQPPAPESWFYGQRRLGMEVRDIYGFLIDGMQGTPGRIRSGGDAAALGMQGSPPTEEPVALFSGIVEIGDDGTAQVAFDLPEFNGTLRLMAVAWTANAVGHGTTDVVVRDPVVVTASLPRVLAPGDTSRLRLDIDNTDGPAGDYVLAIETEGGIAIAEAPAAVSLAKGARTAVAVSLIGESSGNAGIEIRLAHSSGVEVSRSLALRVRPAQQPASDRTIVALAPGERLEIAADQLDGLLPGTASVALSVNRTGTIDVPSLLLALDRYPYGCAEQTTSRALPLLYLSSVAGQTGIADDSGVKERVQKAVYDVLAMQSSSGSFGQWGPGSGDLWLDAYISDFLTRAREEGYDVPQTGFTQAIDQLRNALGYAPQVDGDGEDVAYALYVLARNRQASLGDLRYYAAEKLDKFGSALAKAQIGAALALYGEQLLSAEAFEAAAADLAEAAADGARRDYGSRLRDGAASLALAAETTPPPDALNDLTDLVTSEQAVQRHTSTQENAWLLLAAHGLMSQPAHIALEVDGQPHSGELMRRLSADDLAAHSVRLVNRSLQPVDTIVTVTGVAATPLPAGGNGMHIERQYYTLAGEPVSAEIAGQNERFVVVLTVTEESVRPSRLLVVDLLPGGFEIDNPSLIKSASLEAFSWLEETATAHLEFRDDRFVAALDRTGEEARSFTLAYMVRAVTPGDYVLPAATVEDMYRPDLAARTASGRIEVIAPTP